MSVIKGIDILDNSSKQNSFSKQNLETKGLKPGRNKLSSQQLAAVNKNSLTNIALPKEPSNPAAIVSISRSGYNLMLKSIEKLKESGKDFQIAKLIVPRNIPSLNNHITNLYRKMVDIFA